MKFKKGDIVVVNSTKLISNKAKAVVIGIDNEIKCSILEGHHFWPKGSLLSYDEDQLIHCDQAINFKSVKKYLGLTEN